MAAIITICALGGDWLDKYLELQTPIFTIVLSLLGVAIGLYLVIKEVMKISKDNHE